MSPSFFFRVPEKTPRTVWRCQPVVLTTSSTVAPSGRRSIAITASCFDRRFASDCGSGAGNNSIADRQALIDQLWSASELLPDPEPQSDAKRRSKQDAVIAMLRRPEGATVDEVASTTGWQRHTVRGVFSGTLKKKLGLILASAQEERGRVYRIAEPANV